MGRVGKEGLGSSAQDELTEKKYYSITEPSGISKRERERCE